MGSTLLEITRATHEDIELYQRAIGEELEFTPRNFKENVIQSNKVDIYLNRIGESAKKLQDIYTDADNSRRDEIAAIAGSGPNLYTLFYDRLRELKEYHRKFTTNPMAEKPEEHIYVDDTEALPQFTGEEAYGKALDLHELFEVYINLKSVKKKIDYLTYVDRFYKSFDDNLAAKDNEYRNYLKQLLDYLIQFIRKSQPLFDLDKQLKEIDEGIEKRWSSGEFQGWNTNNNSSDNNNNNNNTESVPTVPIKQEDSNNTAEVNDPLYCKACKKRFAKETVFNAHLTGKKHIRNQEKLSPTPLTKSQFKEVYLLEMKINEFASKLLQEQIDNTKVNIEKKLARSVREQEYEEEEELEEETAEDGEESDAEPEIKMTIDNYPVGWDGKPIPYWLYKLHGLGVEYKCEICGNQSYWGRKAYERHFQEWRHAHGMKCLGIPNTKHFHDITKINDAVQLWSKIRKDTSTEGFKSEVEEEFEDKEGNVFSKKTYEDLRRQGLI